MHASAFFRWVTLATVAVAAAIWFRERATAADLERRLVALNLAEQQLSALRAEQDRLREQLRAASVQSSSDMAMTATRELPPEEAPLAREAFTVGEWALAETWENQGRSTPRSTMTTVLWAAAGGDLPVFKRALEFDDEARAKAREWFESVPARTRALYATPEDLVASATIKNIPPTAAQLIWLNQTDDDHAAVGIMLAAPESSVPEDAPVFEPAVETSTERRPPSVSVANPNRLVMLNLHRSSGGWRVQVPATAIDRLAGDLAASPRSRDAQ